MTQSVLLFFLSYIIVALFWFRKDIIFFINKIKLKKENNEQRNTNKKSG